MRRGRVFRLGSVGLAVAGMVGVALPSASAVRAVPGSDVKVSDRQYVRYDGATLLRSPTSRVVFRGTCPDCRA